jgi:hypothetical protein
MAPRQQAAPNESEYILLSVVIKRESAGKFADSTNELHARRLARDLGHFLSYHYERAAAPSDWPALISLSLR